MICSIFTSDPISGGSGSPSDPPALCGPLTQYVAVLSAAGYAICCVNPLPRDRPLTTLKGRYGYSLTVVHFRKVVIRKKIGSAGNGHPVIYLRSYKAAYYQDGNDYDMGKSFL